jgi:hypothetical protein
MVDHAIVSINLARFFEIVRLLNKTRDLDSRNNHPFDQKRKDYLDNDIVFRLIDHIQLTSELFRSLITFNLVDSKVLPLYNQNCECLLSFLTNYFIYMYDLDSELG